LADEVSSQRAGWHLTATNAVIRQASRACSADAFARRADVAIENILPTTGRWTIHDLPGVTRTLLSTVSGTVRSIFEGGLRAEKRGVVCHELIVICVTGLGVARSQ